MKCSINGHVCNCRAAMDDLRPFKLKGTSRNRHCITVSVQGVKSLGGHFACLCRGFEYHEVKKNLVNNPLPPWTTDDY